MKNSSTMETKKKERSKPVKSYPKPVKRCVVKNCFETDPLSEFRTLHRFPKKPERKKQWCEVIGIQSVTSRDMICDRHFTSSDYGTNYLKTNIVPTKDLVLEYEAETVEFIDCKVFIRLIIKRLLKNYFLVPEPTSIVSSESIKLDPDETQQNTQVSSNQIPAALDYQMLPVINPQIVPLHQSSPSNPVINRVIQPTQPPTLLNPMVLTLPISQMTPEQNARKQKYLSLQSKNTKLKSLIKQLRTENIILKNSIQEYKALLNISNK
jgi:hypothetical protein